MNSISLFIFAIIAICSTLAASPDPRVLAETLAGVARCAVRFRVPPCTVANYVLNPDKSTITPTQKIKCFTKCTVVDSGFLDANGVNVENFVANKVGLGQDEAQVRALAAKCKGIYQGVNDCETSWKLFLCFNGIN